MNNRRRFSGLSFYAILMIAILFSTYMMSNRGQPREVTLSDMEAQLAEGEVHSVVIDGSLMKVTLKNNEGTAGEVYSKAIHPVLIEDYVLKLRDALDRGDLTSFDYNQPADFSGILNIIMVVLMVGALGGFVYLSYMRQGGGDGKSAMSFGRSRAKLNDPAKNTVNFNDVAGAEEEKEELHEVVDFLKSPQKYTELGAKIPRGILLIGPPGTGKTLLAKAVAGEAGVPFFSISGSDFVEMFVGVGASRVRSLFDDAKKNAPCIIFIDEIDAVGRHRGAGLGGGHDEREQTLNQLLVEMDGFGPNEGVIIMAATNRPDILDPALLRPGRFDRRVTVMRPDQTGREAILKVHARNKPLADDVALGEIAKITPGFTGADLANLLNEAALLAARKNAKLITYSDISEAVFKVTFGPEKKSRIISQKERELTAYHESGHAIVIRAMSETDKIERVTIIPAGGAGGYTAFKPQEDMYFQTRGQLVHMIMAALGGRAAESLVFDDISTGAGQDLKQINQIARDMVTKYGMSERVGNMVADEGTEVFLGKDYSHTRTFSERLSAVIDEEVKAIIDSAYADTVAVLEQNRELLDELAKRLLEKEKIESAEFEAIYAEFAVNFKPAPGDSEKPVENVVEVAPPAEALPVDEETPPQVTPDGQ